MERSPCEWPRACGIKITLNDKGEFRRTGTDHFGPGALISGSSGRRGEQLGPDGVVLEALLAPGVIELLVEHEVPLVIDEQKLLAPQVAEDLVDDRGLLAHDAERRLECLAGGSGEPGRHTDGLGLVLAPLDDHRANFFVAILSGHAFSLPELCQYALNAQMGVTESSPDEITLKRIVMLYARNP